MNGVLKSPWFLSSTGLLAIISIYLVTDHLFKREKIRRIKSSLNKELLFEMSPDASGKRKSKEEPSEEIIREQLSRNYAFLGEEGENKVRGSFVIIVGVGGVGSHAAHMLLRAGVEKMRIIDFDQVTLSSLNRHAVATQADVGLSKTACLKNHFLQICPHAKIDSVVELFNKDKAAQLMAGNPDFVLDCIDHIPSKVDLLSYCVLHDIPVISSMGAGSKADPSRICIADICDTQEDSLARATRRGLRKLGIDRGITVIYSVEKPGNPGLVPLEDEKVGDAEQYSTLPTFRSRILPVLGTLPALFGNAMATHVLTQLAAFPTEPLSNKLRTGVYIKMHRDLTLVEQQKYNREGAIPLTMRDIAYIYEEVWRGRSALSGALDRLVLVRWIPSLPLAPNNIICFTRKEAIAHETIMKTPNWQSEYPAEFLEYVERRFSQEKNWSDFKTIYC